jgi:hypothetical protein
MDEEIRQHLINIYGLLLEQTEDSIDFTTKFIEIEGILESVLKRLDKLEEDSLQHELRWKR